MRSSQPTRQLSLAAGLRQEHRTAQHLQVMVNGLAEAEKRGSNLEELTARALALSAHTDLYLAAALHDARARGLTWSEVARQTRLNEATVRAMGDLRTPLPPATVRSCEAQAANSVKNTAGTAAATDSRRLGAALSCLLYTRHVTVQETARKAGLSHACVLRLVNGQRVPDWSVVFATVMAAGGRPEEFRHLWEEARRIQRTPQRSAAASLTRFRDALRGLRWAAGHSTSATVGGLDDHTVLAAVMDGELVPDWPMTQQIVRDFKADPDQVKDLWQNVRYSLLTTYGFLSFQEVPGADNLT